ncbi:MAG: hypothetical protein DMF68_16310 [Acidobacteria bacterium]|nr:MAG: hypothetical protein DMF68_16310 [Acidobacteriota bacterium]
MSTSLRNQQKLFGLFELDPLGTILYSRIEPDGEANEAAPNVAGHNFFDEVAPFENAEELRQRISNFIHSDGQAENFHFTCQCDAGRLPVKVLLARIRERSNGQHTKSILMHIRKVQQASG